VRQKLPSGQAMVKGLRVTICEPLKGVFADFCSGI